MNISAALLVVASPVSCTSYVRTNYLLHFRYRNYSSYVLCPSSSPSLPSLPPHHPLPPHAIISPPFFFITSSASKLEEVPEKIPLQDRTEFQEVEVDMQLAGVVHESDDEEDFELPPEVDVRKKKSKLTEYQVDLSVIHTHTHAHTHTHTHTHLSQHL